MALAALALVLMAGSPLFAGPPPPTYPTAEFYLNGVGAGNVLAGVYTSPYHAAINPTVPHTGAPTGGTALSVICDDFGSESFINEYWDTLVTPLTGANSLTSGTGLYGAPDTLLKWGTSNTVVVDDTKEANTAGLGAGSLGVSQSLSQLEAYDVAALLAINIMSISNGSGDATQLGDYSFALWALFDTVGTPGHYSNAPLDQLYAAGSNPNGCATTNYGCLKSAMQYLQTAVYDVKKLAPGHIGTAVGNDGTALSAYLSHYNVNIYSYDAYNPTGTALQPPVCYSGPSNCPPPPQEFITVTNVPEPTSLAVLGTYALFGGASLLFFGRRRIFGTRS